jgi:DNA repair protein SbcD/Mre11
LTCGLKSGARDALIIAGDIFDSVNPPAGAQRRFFDFLARAHAAVPGLQVIVIAGNHDAGARLEAPAGLFESMNIKAVGTIARDTAGEVQYDKILVPLKDANGCVRAIVLAVPFLRPADVPAVPESSDSYLTGIREFYRRAPKQRSLSAIASIPAQFSLLLVTVTWPMRWNRGSRSAE